MIEVVEVGPRDGLQNEPAKVSTRTKIELINRLADSGLRAIEATSFVSPKWVPQLADAAEVMAGIDREPGIRYPVLTPNLQGYERAREAGAGEVAVFTAASQTFCQKNTNCTIAESLQRIAQICQPARTDQIPVRGYISCVLGCPYEGKVARSAVVAVAESLIELGCYQISLGDTIGIGTPREAAALIVAVAENIGRSQLAVHFHDTRGQALANSLACLESGVTVFDASVAGLGGCPYAPGASGNLATEDLVYMLHGMGEETGIDLNKLVDCGRYISDALKRPNRSRVAQTIPIDRP